VIINRIRIEPCTYREGTIVLPGDILLSVLYVIDCGIAIIHRTVELGVSSTEGDWTIIAKRTCDVSTPP
jgi:hypothetical protein